MHFPVVGVITDHLIDGSWYGDNTYQRGNRLRFLAETTLEERTELSYKKQVLVFSLWFVLSPTI
jgi:hypothetical protein